MKKILLLVLAALLVLSAFAGCGMRTHDSGSGKNSDIINADDDPFKGKVGDPGKFEHKEYDLGGKPLRFVSAKSVAVTKDDTTPLVEKNPIRYYSMKDTEKRFNCKISFVGMEFNNLIKSFVDNHIAGTYEYEIYSLSYGSIPAIINSGACLPMSDYYDFENDPTWINNPSMIDKGWWMGKKYGVYDDPPLGGYATWYNKDLLAKFNLKDPWTYVESDTWTWENFRQMCLKATVRDPNGSQSYYGWACETPYSTFIVSNGATIVKVLNGKPTFVLDSKEGKEAINYVIKLDHNDKVLASWADLVAIGCPDENPPFYAMATGRVLFFQYTANYGGWLYGEKGMDPKSIGYVYNPKGPSAKDYHVHSRIDNNWWVMPSDIDENLREAYVAATQDFAAFWSQWKTNSTPYEMAFDNYFVSSTKQIYTPQVMEMIKKIPEITVITLEDNFRLNVGEMYISIAEGGATVDQALTVYKESFQAEIDAMMKKNTYY